MAEAKRKWGLMIFGLPFAGVGFGFILLGVIPSVYDWWRMQSWQPVAAELLSAHLESHRGDNSTTYRVTASYRYRYSGEYYQGTRVAISAISDNIGDFQYDLGRRLESLHSRGQPVDAWVNPRDPAEAVIDRSLRPGLMLFKLVFGLVFGGVGSGLIWSGWRRPIASDPLPFASVAHQPWLSQPEWADNAIASNQKSLLVLAWIISSFWLLVSSPILFFLPRELAKHNYVALVALIFPLVGLWLLAWAIRVTRNWRYWGELRLRLDPFPGSIGGQVGGSLDLPLAYDAKLRLPVALLCLHKYTSGSGEDSETRDSVVWQAEGLAHLEPSGRGSCAKILFDVPPGLPASECPQGDYHYWRLDIACDQLQPKLQRQFDIPVFPLVAKASFLSRESTRAPGLRDQREAQIDEVSDLEQIPGGVRLYFPYGRSWRGALMAFLGGLLCTGIGLAVHFDGGPIIFLLVFGAFGLPMIIGGFYTAANSLRVTLDKRGLETQRRILGLPLARRFLSAADIKQLELSQSFSATRGNGRQITYYKIQARSRGGQKVTLAESLRGRETAVQLLESIALLSGYPAKPG